MRLTKELPQSEKSLTKLVCAVGVKRTIAILALAEVIEPQVVFYMITTHCPLLLRYLLTRLQLDKKQQLKLVNVVLRERPWRNRGGSILPFKIMVHLGYVSSVHGWSFDQIYKDAGRQGKINQLLVDSIGINRFPISLRCQRYLLVPMLECGLNVNTTTKYYRNRIRDAINCEKNVTLLHQAVYDVSSTNVKILIDFGADIDAKTSFGNTVLHFIAEYYNDISAKDIHRRGPNNSHINVMEILALLLTAGASRTAKNIMNLTPRMLALAHGNNNIALLLQE